MAFDYDEINPTNDSYIADFPANERAHRTAVLGSVDTEHYAETSGQHRQVTLAPLGADPLLSGAAGFVYAKDVGGITELFYQDEGAQVIQLTSDGSASPDKVAKAGDTMTGDLLIDTADLEVLDGEARFNGSDVLLQGDALIRLLNAKYINARNAANDAWLELIGIDASDVAEIGNTDSGARIRTSGVDAAVVDYGSGDKKIWHEGNLTVPLFTQEYLSADIVFAQSDAGADVHGIGETPKLWASLLKCVSADLSYVVGDVVPILNGIADSANTSIITTALSADGTTFLWRTGDQNVRLVRDGGGTSQIIDTTKWRLIFKAWY